MSDARLKTRYSEEIRPALIERFGYSTPMQAPRIVKVTVNMGVGDAKQDSKVLEAASEQLASITGQQPNVRRARKSIAQFKLREGMPVGLSVTLRGDRLYEFLDRLFSVAIPRIRDFRGISPKSFDGRGNFTLGLREQIIFPEINYDEIDQSPGHGHHDHDERRVPTRSPSRCWRHSVCRSRRMVAQKRPRHGTKEAMAKTSQKIRQQRTPKFKTRGNTPCRRCGRARACTASSACAGSACASSLTRGTSPA